MKKVIALLLAVAMLLSLVGCGKKATTEAPATNDTPAATEAPAAAATEAPAADTASEPVDLTMWCIAVESDSNRHAYEAGIADFQAAHPEINFTWETTQNQEYKTKIKAAVAANELPDIFYTWGCAFLGDFVEAGRVYDSSAAYAKFAANLPEVSMTNLKFDGKYYAAPITMNIVCMFSNMELLKQAGFDKVPGTYDELIACCDALVAKGIIPFGCSGKETWCVTEYLESIIEKTAGAAAMNDIFTGKASWGNDDVVKAVGLFQEMINKKYFDPEGIALSNDEVKANFIAGKYAFYINGSWNCADFANAGLTDKVQVAEFPVIDSSKSKLGELIGGPTDGLAVAASSPNAAVAADSAFEIAQNVCKYGYIDGNGLPAWTQDPNGDYSTINPLTQTVAQIVGNSSFLVPFGDNAMDADTANIYLDYVSQIYSSAIDGRAFVDGLVKDIR
jgi:raffinose/stachyose/melibiose transport system substrate-binding protein